MTQEEEETESSKLSRFYNKYPLYLWGLLGTSIMISTALITAQIYKDANGNRYSITQYFISELGQISESEAHWLFNIGIGIGGFMLIIYMIGVGSIFKTKLGFLTTIIGGISALCAGLVGVFPMDYLKTHAIVAFGFFFGGLITVVLFSILILIDKKRLFPKWFSLLGVFVAMWFALFLFYPYKRPQAPNENTLDTSGINRPEFWLMPFFEWMVYFAMLLWIITIAIFLRKKGIKNPLNINNC